MNLEKNFDVIVIGAGHAGCEAAAAAARSGVNTALITNSLATIGEMSCNPAIGGLGKGHLVREIDALDGIMGIVADQSGIQFRLLNSSRGHAVRGPRTQSDRELYKKYMQKLLLSYCNLNLFYDPVTKFQFSKKKIISIETKSGNSFSAKKFILTTGTFLNGLIHIGDEKISAGRIDEKPTLGLSEQLKKLNFKIGRLKTGTPPRLDGTTINYDQLEMQAADEKPFLNSALNLLKYRPDWKRITRFRLSYKRAVIRCVLRLQHALQHVQYVTNTLLYSTTRVSQIRSLFQIEGSNFIQQQNPYITSQHACLIDRVWSWAWRQRKMMTFR